MINETAKYSLALSEDLLTLTEILFANCESFPAFVDLNEEQQTFFALGIVQTITAIVKESGGNPFNPEGWKVASAYVNSFLDTYAPETPVEVTPLNPDGVLH